jgi:predicted phosphodiesterase
MDFQIVSDLHVDFKENKQWVPEKVKPIAEILLVAGDTCEFRKKFRSDFLESFFKQWRYVIEVPGNHDLYSYSFPENLFGKFKETNLDSSGNCQHIYCNNETIVFNDIAIICSTLWSNVRPQNELVVRRSMNDYNCIRNFSVNTNNCLHQLDLKFINEALEKNKDKKCIVLTHHLPHWSLIANKFSGLPMNDAYASDLSRTFENYSENLKYWIYGHSHEFLEKKINETICLRNPVGYVRHNESNKYRNVLISL